MNCKKEDFLLYAVTDRAWLGEASLYEQVEQALQGGVTFVQLREKHLDAERLRLEAAEIRDLCRRYRTPFVINDNVFLAKEVDADGVHVGQKDMSAAEARKLLGPDRIIGVTARTVEQALTAQAQGADYLGVGAAFATGTKADAVAISHETLRQICAAVQIPVVAIGGISRKNVMRLAGAGIDGVAVVSAIFSAADIRGETKLLKAQVRNMLERGRL